MNGNIFLTNDNKFSKSQALFRCWSNKCNKNDVLDYFLIEGFYGLKLGLTLLKYLVVGNRVKNKIKLERILFVILVAFCSSSKCVVNLRLIFYVAKYTQAFKKASNQLQSLVLGRIFASCFQLRLIFKHSYYLRLTINPLCFNVNHMKFKHKFLILASSEMQN